MTALYLYDDLRARSFEPFASTRPISEMVAGTALIRRRWGAALASATAHFLAGLRHLDFDEPGATAATGTIPAGSIVALSRCVPALPADPANVSRRAATCSMWRCGTELAAVRIKEPIDVDAFADGKLTLEQLAAGTGAIGTLDGWWLEEVWDLVALLPVQLASDLASPAFASGHAPPDAAILGTGRVPAASACFGSRH